MKKSFAGKTQMQRPYTELKYWGSIPKVEKTFWIQNTGTDDMHKGLQASIRFWPTS